MRDVRYANTIAKIYDAAIEPSLWPQALAMVAQTLDVLGAAYFVIDKRHRNLKSTSFAGPIDLVKAEYRSYYWAVDPYRPLVEAAPTGQFVQLSQRLAAPVLHTSEWYNDFVRAAGVHDLVAARLYETESEIMVAGVHYAPQGSATPHGPVLADARLLSLFDALRRAARIHSKVCGLHWRAAIGTRLIDHIAVGVIVCDRYASVLETNHAAEQAIMRGDGLLIRNGQLCARRVFETEHLNQLILAAAGARRPLMAGHMLVAGAMEIALMPSR